MIVILVLLSLLSQVTNRQNISRQVHNTKKPAKYYPLRFQEYLNELIQNHSRMKE